MGNILELQDISHAYHGMEGETLALSHLSFSLKQGDFVSIVGPSGCGKSTLLSIISGLIPPESGTVKLAGNHIGYMLQKDHLLEWRSVYRNIILGLEVQNSITADTKEKAYGLLKQYGLEQFASAKPSELSGGMRQRVALIRTLILEPDLLLLDEPFSALDYQTRLAVGDDIGQIIRREKRTAILVTHDLAEAISLGDRVIVLTERPGSVKTIVPIYFPEEKNTPLLRRNTPEFNEYFHAIWKELNVHE
ncbi:MAG: ABC transporter ATP-binding protein [Tyzzerella sp.]|nr:ABC transporter ATP-binding protein [Tyzzerella sp.]